MPRPLRIQYEGAIYHVMSRGDRRQAIFVDDADRRAFVDHLGRACAKTGWQVHAYVLMSNHFHLVLETPQPNLSVGMKWLLGAYTQAFNRRHRQWGHLFGGRYKAQHIDERDPRYLKSACDYVHLNPARAGLVGEKDNLEVYPWSSYRAYVRAPERPVWLRCERLLAEHGAESQDAQALRRFKRQNEGMRSRSGDRSGEIPNLGGSGAWRIGAEDFTAWLAERLKRRGRKTERASERRETDERLAERIIREALVARGWSASTLRLSAKGDPVKVDIARQVRTQTPMTLAWIARHLAIGSASYLAALLTKEV